MKNHSDFHLKISFQQVLKLLNDALNRSGGHYSIEYVGGNRDNMEMDFKRRRYVNSKTVAQSEASLATTATCSSTSSNLLEPSKIDAFVPNPTKKRRYSDSNMSVNFPMPRTNIKGSLSLEGDSRQQRRPPDLHCLLPIKQQTLSVTDSEGDIVEWSDPYSPAPSKYRNVFFDSSCESIKDDPTVSDSQDTVFSEEPDSVFSGPSKESPTKQSRKMWYKHKYFSTPIHEEKPTLNYRSTSLPLPESEKNSTSQLFSSTEQDIPLITVSSPSESQKESKNYDCENNNAGLNNNNKANARPSVIQALPKVENGVDCKVVRNLLKDCPTTGGWIDCSKKRKRSRMTFGGSLGVSEVVDLTDQPSSRSSCLKTTRRTEDQVEVISFDNFPL